MINKKDIMHLESLLYLLAVTEYSGKRKASEALSSSVDTINKYIDSLEKDLSQKLLYSDGRGCNLTEKGRKLTERAKQIKDILKDIYKKTEEIHAENAEFIGDVQIAIASNVNSNLFVKNLKAFFELYPEIKITQTVTVGAPRLDDMVYDIGISNEKPLSSDVVVMAQKEVSTGFFASPSYLDKHGYPLNFDDMLQNHVLLCRPSCATCDKNCKGLLKKAKYVSFRSNSPYALHDCVKDGMGISLLPLCYKNRGLVCLDNISSASKINYYLFSHKNVKDIPRVRAVINFYKNIIEEME